MMNMEKALETSVSQGEVPFAVAAIGSADRILWAGAAGNSQPNAAADHSTVFRLASMSKAIGATAAAILADRGQLQWDTPVDAILPGFADVQLLDGFDGEKARLRRPASCPTLRQLASHTSGLTYEFYDATIARYITERNIPSMTTSRWAGLATPLAFDPGTRWGYGGGLDWLGLAVAAIDGRPIERFCAEEIFSPLGMADTAFEATPVIASRKAQVSARGPGGGFMPAPVDLDPPSEPEFYGMGNALYSTVGDYLKFLRMWLGKGALEGTRILCEETAEAFLRSQIGPLRMQPMQSTVPFASADLDPLPGYQKSHSLGFARLEEPIPGRRGAGSQFWGGVMNTHFWLDPERDIAGVFMTQLLPFLDPRAMRALERFELAAYAAFR